MSVASRPADAYTDAPALHPNLLAGSLHLLFWLCFHPVAWVNHAHNDYLELILETGGGGRGCRCRHRSG